MGILFWYGNVKVRFVDFVFDGDVVERFVFS